MKLRAIGVLLALCGLAACGSPTDAVTFKAPPDYKSAASVGPFMQAWSGPRDAMLMFMAFPVKLDLNRSISESPINGATVQSDKEITICGNQPAHFGQMIGSNVQTGSAAPAAKKDQQIEFLVTNAGGKTYMAVYIRPIGTQPDRDAEAALHNICPR